MRKGIRVGALSKEQILYTCVCSLARSIVSCLAMAPVFSPTDIAPIFLTVVDDRSDPDILGRIQVLLELLKVPHEFVLLTAESSVGNVEKIGTGNRASLLTAFEIGRTSPAPLIYFVEDDYLHFPSAIAEMLEAHAQFTQNLGGQSVALFPQDYPDNYRPEMIELCRVVVSGNRHWRTGHYTTGTFLVPRKTLIEQYRHYLNFAEYGVHPQVHEGNTLNLVYRESAILFSPMPSLAMHLTFNEEVDPVLDWSKLWRDTQKWQEAL